MHFRNISIRNFLSIAEADLEFTPGVHLICGLNKDMGASRDESNGAGKSSIFDAIRWALFGSVNREGAKSDDVINVSAKKDCLVTLDLEIDGKPIKIRRARGHTQFGNSLVWFKDGEEFRSHRKQDTEKELEAFLPMSERLFNYSVEVGQGMPYRFLNLSETAKQDLLCEVMNLSMYDTALDTAKQKESVVTQETFNFESILSAKQKEVERLEAYLKLYEQELAKYRSQAGFNPAETDAQIAAHELKAVDLSAEKALVEVYIAEHTTMLQMISEKIKEIDSSLGQLRESYASIKGQMSAVEKQKERLSGLGAVCPTCQQTISGSVTEHISKLHTEIVGYTDVLQQCSSIADPFTKERGGLSQQHTEISCKLNGYNSRLREINNSIQDGLLRKAALQNSVEKHKSEEAGIVAKLEHTQKMRETIISDMKGIYEKLEASRTALRYRQFWVNSIPNLRASAVSEVLQFLNERIDFYMDIFSEGAMGMKLFQEAYGKGSKIRVDLRTPGGAYGISSGGEKRRVDLSLYLALSDLAQSSSETQTNLLVADEVMDGLSPAGVEKFLQAMRLRANNGVCVYAVSHNPAVTQYFQFDSMRVVQKQDGKAYLY